ncbi:MAG TPA: CaiB/BaiF CoA-transferase family protein [Candidatus Binataceae bacterium]|nr:CaiB/BaiF CoA-transferase family protein [Candidatus Binataceae bacterium]
MSLPLNGYRVIELAQIYAGPYCGLQLAHFGAEVIKIEPPGTGELLRKRPPAKHGTNYGFLMLNTGKKSVSLNLKDPRGRDILFRMLADSDVILENYAPGALERLGLGYEDLASRFPRLVYASSKGYGGDSRFAQLGAMDFTIQAASGIISMTGYGDRPGVRVSAALIDTSTGMHLAAGILAALLERERTGRGRKVEVAMLDVCMPAINGAIGVAHDGYKIRRVGNRHPTTCPCNTYPCADGEIWIYCLTEANWHQLARLMSREELIAHPDYKDHQSRYKMVDEVDAMVGRWSSMQKRDDLVTLLIANSIPCAPVREIDEVAADPELPRRHVVRDGTIADHDDIKVLGSAIKMSGLRGDEIPSHVPELGEHTSDVLQRLGISADELETLRRDGVI